METTRGWKAVIIIALLLSSSCRFKFPTTNEGQTLAKKGTFSNSLPAWVKAPEDMGAASVSREGLAPQSYGAATPVKTAQSNSPTRTLEDQRDQQRQREADEFEKRREQLEDEEEGDSASSPLDRIEAVCPGVESEVTAALKTIDIKQRIQKYANLTLSCPNSSDLWFWLGRDYHDSGQLAEAVRAYEQVLVLDPRNQAAQALLDDARSGAARTK